jgi:vancomycin resistance protein YoaR
MKIKNYQQAIINKIKIGRKTRLVLIFLASFLLLLVIVFSGYSYSFRDKAYIGLNFAGQNLGAQGSGTITETVKSRSDNFLGKTITVKSSSKDYPISLSELTLSYDAEESANRAASLYHGNNLNDYWQRARMLFVKKNLVPVYNYNQATLTEKINTIAKDLDVPEKDYGLKILAGQVEVTTERAAGKRFNQDKFLADFNSRVEVLSTESIVPLIGNKAPSVTLENANIAKKEAETVLAGGDLTLTNADKSYIIDTTTLSNWITATPADSDLIVDIDRVKLKDFLSTVASSINVGAQDAMLAVSNGAVAISQPSRDGASVDIDSTSSKIATAILSRIHLTSATDIVKTLPIDVVVTKPSITSDTLATLGLRDLIGSGTTSFTTSPANRITNITVGARLLNGILLKPGETFSTLAHLGNIDASSGFLPELVIKDNRTVPEYGGGLCQVSTTLFRTALNAGLKIVERQNHSYRVSYYEPPVGMDATIYDPAPDFKFQNDTAGYLLVQSHIDGKKITFDFYGTKDGRVATTSVPTLYDVTPPPDPIMEQTDTLPTGVQQQVDHAHDGASASFDYLVIRGADTLEKVTFTSHYVPWPARFLVGTGPVAPAPTPPADPVAPVATTP